MAALAVTPSAYAASGTASHGDKEMARGDFVWLRHFAALSIIFAVAGSNAEEPWQHLTSSAIRSAFSGRELSDNLRFKHRYLSDGALQGIESGQSFEARWRVERDELCVARPTPQINDECYEVQKKGAEFRFLQDGYVIFQGRLNAVPRSVR